MKANNNGNGHHWLSLVMLSLAAMMLAWNFNDIKRYVRMKMM